MADLNDGQRSPKLGQGLLLGGDHFSKLAENPIFQRLISSKWFRVLPPWVWGGMVLGVLFAAIWIINSRVSPTTTMTSPSVGSDTTGLAVDILVKLSLIVGLIYAALWMFRRWRGADLRSGTKKIDVLETVHLSPRRAMHLVQAGDQVILIGATDQNVSLLATIEASTSPSSAQSGSVFAQVLADEAGAEDINGSANNKNSSAVIEKPTIETGKRSAKSEKGSAKNEFSTAINGHSGIREVVLSEAVESTHE